MAISDPERDEVSYSLMKYLIASVSFIAQEEGMAISDPEDDDRDLRLSIARCNPPPHRPAPRPYAGMCVVACVCARACVCAHAGV